MKKKQSQTLEKVFSAIVLILFLGFTLVWFFCVLNSSYVNTDLMVEYVYEKKDNFFINILFLGILLLAVALLGKISKNLSEQQLSMIALIISLICTVISLFLVNIAKTVPQADQAFIVRDASAFNSGDVSSLQKGGYSAIYSQQLGIITVLRIIFKLFGDGNYQFFQYFTCISVFFSGICRL